MSCSGATDPAGEREASVQGTGSPAELRARWEQWRTVGPESYGYLLAHWCFCPGDEFMPVWLDVRDGQVVRAFSLRGIMRPAPTELFYPIDSIFAEAIRSADIGGRIVVSYHPDLGYPERLEIGDLALDAGVLYRVPRLIRR